MALARAQAEAVIKDDSSPERTRIQALREHISALQKGMPNRARLIAGVEHGIMSALAALLAYLPAEALGLKQSFWGAITAIAVVQTEYAATRMTARDQFTGAAIGGLTGVGTVLATGQNIASYSAAVVISVLACWLLNVASAARLSGVTATIIMLVPHEGSAERMMVARVSEVGWGVSVAIMVVWIASHVGAIKKGG